jgi:hypothetical protein
VILREHFINDHPKTPRGDACARARVCVCVCVWRRASERKTIYAQQPLPTNKQTNIYNDNNKTNTIRIFQSIKRSNFKKTPPLHRLPHFSFKDVCLGSKHVGMAEKVIKGLRGTKTQQRLQ